MKIYEIGTGYTPIPANIGAATEIVVEELTKEFLLQGHSSEIIDIAAENRRPHFLPIQEVKVPSIFTGTDIQLGIMHKMKRVAYSVALAGKLKSILKTDKTKIVLHFHNQYNLFFFLKLVPKHLRDNCIVAYTNHSGIWSLPWSEIENTIRKRYFQEAECMKNADLVFLLNEETKRNVMTHLGVPERRIVLIGNGVNTHVYYPLDENAKQKAREKWDLTAKTVILQVGSVYENKGQLRALETILPLLNSENDVMYAYAGGIIDREYKASVQRFAEEHGVSDRVRYLGMIQPGAQLNKLYNAATATIFPSRYEGFPLVPIESISSGTPVMLDSDSTINLGPGEIIYSNENIERVARALDDESVYNRLCSSARSTAMMKYSWSKIAEDYLIAFERGKEIV